MGRVLYQCSVEYPVLSWGTHRFKFHMSGGTTYTRVHDVGKDKGLLVFSVG